MTLPPLIPNTPASRLTLSLDVRSIIFCAPLSRIEACAAAQRGNRPA
jgi:hypothetical protein